MFFLNFLRDFIITCCIFIPLERWLALHREQPIMRKGWLVDLFHSSVSQIGAGVIVVMIVEAVTPVLTNLFTNLHTVVASQASWLQFIEAVLLIDLSAYTAHLISHKVPYLWRFHAIHHSSEQMDWLAAFRFHPVDLVYKGLFNSLPVVIMGFTVEMGLAYTIFVSYQGFLIHSNIRVRLGPVRWIFSTPEFHHWHHANQQEAYDKNYGGMFAFFDVIFGTLYMPKKQWPRVYGVNEKVGNNYLLQLAAPFKAKIWHYDVVSAPSVTENCIAEPPVEAASIVSSR